MAFKLRLAGRDDIPAVASIFMEAMTNDSFWTILKGNPSREQELEDFKAIVSPRLGLGAELGVCQTWAVVDENDKIVAWAGLRVPKELTPEELKAITPGWTFSGNRNEELANWMRTVLIPAESVYDISKDCMRQSTMVHPAYQRRGFGRMLTRKINEVADDLGASIYVRARPTAASLFLTEGYTVEEKLDLDLSEYKPGAGKTCFFVMKREPGAKSIERT